MLFQFGAQSVRERCLVLCTGGRVDAVEIPHTTRTTGVSRPIGVFRHSQVHKRRGNGHELVYNQFGVGGTVDNPAVFFEDGRQVVYIECAPHMARDGGRHLLSGCSAGGGQSHSTRFLYLAIMMEKFYSEVKAGNACESMMVVALK